MFQNLPLGALAFCLVLLIVMAIWSTINPDTTTDAEINNASRTLEKQLAKAEALTKKYNRTNSFDLERLEAARNRLHFSRRSSRLVVTPSMVLKKRIQGINIMRKYIATFPQ